MSTLSTLLHWCRRQFSRRVNAPACALRDGLAAAASHAALHAGGGGTRNASARDSLRWYPPRRAPRQRILSDWRATRTSGRSGAHARCAATDTPSRCIRSSHGVSEATATHGHGRAAFFVAILCAPPEVVAYGLSWPSLIPSLGLRLLSIEQNLAERTRRKITAIRLPELTNFLTVTAI